MQIRPLPLGAFLLVVCSLVPARAGAPVGHVITVRKGESLRRAVDKARPGDTVQVHSGTYTESLLYLPSGIRLVSFDGPGQAIIDGAGEGDMLTIFNRKNIVIDGFEIRNAGQHIVKVEASSDIVIRNCKIHGSRDGDCVKVTVRSERVTLEGCEIYDPGMKGTNSFEQNVDFIDTREGVVRGCLLYHVDGRGDQIGYFKGGSTGCLFERNVIVNAGGGDNDSPAWTLGQQTDSEYKNGDYECRDAVVRDNVFVNCTNGAMGFYGCRGGYAYNNVLVNSFPPFGFHRSGNTVSPAVDKIYIYGNSILNPDGKLSYFFEGAQNLDGELKHDRNWVWNADKKLPGDFKEENPRTAKPSGALDTNASPSEGVGRLLERFSRFSGLGVDLLNLLPPAARVPDPPEIARPKTPQPRVRAPIRICAVPPSPAIADQRSARPEPVTIRDLGFFLSPFRVTLCPVEEGSGASQRTTNSTRKRGLSSVVKPMPKGGSGF